MLRQGPIPPFVHGVLEYAIGVLLIAAPFLFDFDSAAATAVALVLGIVVLVSAASSPTRAGLSPVVPVAIHVLTDLVLSGIMVAAPFLFGFSDEAAPTAFFLVLGVAGVLLTIATRFLPERAADARAS